MYDNIGKKIKIITIIHTIIFIILSMSAGVILVFKEINYGYILIFLVPFVIWASSFVLYGFGELVEKTCDIRRKICGERVKKIIIDENNDNRRRDIDKLRFQGLITDEEYREAIKKLNEEEVL